MAWAPPSKPGDTDPLISDAKHKLRIYSYGKAEGLGTVDVSDVYTEGFGRALVKYKQAIAVLVDLGRLSGPKPDTDTEFDWATKKQMGLLDTGAPPVAKLKPLWISVEGHLSDMWIGPAVECGRVLEREGHVQLQPTGYDNARIPFNNQSGVDEIARFFRDPHLMPIGRKFFLSGFSQGDIVVSQFLQKHLLPSNGVFHDRIGDWLGALEFGAPYRPKDVVAPWVTDPPKRGTQGISPQRFKDDHGGRIAYVCRTRDLYTEVTDDGMGRKQSSIYEIVANSDPKALLFELIAAGINPTAEVIQIAYAILDGALFLPNMDAHGGYDLAPCIDWARARVQVRTP